MTRSLGKTIIPVAVKSAAPTRSLADTQSVDLTGRTSVRMSVCCAGSWPVTLARCSRASRRTMARQPSLSNRRSVRARRHMIATIELVRACLLDGSGCACHAGRVQVPGSGEGQRNHVRTACARRGRVGASSTLGGLMGAGRVVGCCWSPSVGGDNAGSSPRSAPRNKGMRYPADPPGVPLIRRVSRTSCWSCATPTSARTVCGCAG
jgi:hypothetical protein